MGQTRETRDRLNRRRAQDELLQNLWAIGLSVWSVMTGLAIAALLLPLL